MLSLDIIYLFEMAASYSQILQDYFCLNNKTFILKDAIVVLLFNRLYLQRI